jgi:arginine decarboxylase
VSLDQSRTPLFEAVKYHVKRNAIPLQIPCHKHGHGLTEYEEFVGENVLRMDLNQTRGIDLVWNPTKVILESEALLADAFGAERAYFLINGTTSGVQAMIMSACKPGSQIIIPRNAHKSIFNGLILSGAEPVYVQPEIDQNLGIVLGITETKLAAVIKQNPDASAVLTINPSYYGIAGHLKQIVDLAHRNDMPVLVDEAHGSHMHFHPGFPVSAMQAGADLSAASLHKTGGSMTQSSVLLLNDTPYFDADYVRQVINLTYTSSPSYILLCSLDVARKQLATSGEEILGRLLEMLRWTRSEINSIDGLFAPDNSYFANNRPFYFDETKLLVNVHQLGLTGYEVEELLARDYNILIELADKYNILAITCLGDQRSYLEAFVKALKDIAAHAPGQAADKIQLIEFNPVITMPPREAFYGDKKPVALERCAGRVAGEMIMVYPPGIPLVSMGEIITGDIIDYIRKLKEARCTLVGTADPEVEYIMVID